jgi:hypothetical protein
MEWGVPARTGPENTFETSPERNAMGVMARLLLVGLAAIMAADITLPGADAAMPAMPAKVTDVVFFVRSTLPLPAGRSRERSFIHLPPKDERRNLAWVCLGQPNPSCYGGSWVVQVGLN